MRIGVYICHCGRNIADVVNVREVVEFAKSLDGVVVARDYKYMCSDPGQELIIKDVQELKLDRVVVAACSPKLHELTFRKALKRAGLNPFLFQMANIRELCSWVTSNGKDATEKAKAYVKSAVERVKLHESLKTIRVKITPSVLVIGGGIAGISASLLLADAGVKVYLVEKEPTIGGKMAKFDKTFPTLDCSACILTPKMNAVKEHPNIELITYAEVEDVKGYVGNFTVKIRKKARYVKEDVCTGCYDCIENCLFEKPEFPSEFDEGIGKRKPIYIPFPQAVPLVPVIDPNTCMWLKAKKCSRYCMESCEAKAIDFNQKDEIIEVKVGAIIVAIGYKPFDAKKIKRYRFGELENVYTSLQVERMLNSAGPTSGEVLLANGEKPKRVAIIHCVGSRDDNYNPYCSRVCCMYSIKLARLIKERTKAEVYNFYIDIRAFGKMYEEFYRKAMEEGIKFIRGRVAEITDIPKSEDENGKLIVVYEDTLLGRVMRLPVDMVVLSVGLEPPEDIDKIRTLLKLSCTPDGFLAERHPKLAPVSTTTEGIFIAGCCSSPKDIPDSVAQAEASAGEALSLIKRSEIELEPVISQVIEEKCSGCGICVPLCPYNAISLINVDGKKRAYINPALCMGCGVCVASCPSKAIRQNMFGSEQITAEIRALLK
ncbi:4Fe-4S dicluster domain-containing protein [Archaeoglobus sp.]